MFSSTAKKIISSFFLTATLSSVLFLLPVALNTNTVSVAYAQETTIEPDATIPAQTTSHVGTTAETIKDRCTSFFSGSVSDCVLLLEYYLMVSVPRQLLLFAANVFDTMWAFGLSSETFTLGNSPDSFINAGWVVCRDVANTFFIFILLYIAIMTIFQRDQKRLLSTLVVVALLINFSMYITKFVIDVGNIFALEFYSSFPINSNPLVNIPGIEQHSIGSGFMKALESPLENIIQDIPNLTAKGFGVQAAVIALTGIEFLVVTFVFLLSGFYLVGRVVTLWIVMITAPIAFFSLTLPSEVSGVSIWGEWKSKLISNAFFPAIFLFFIYIAAKIANGNSWILQNFATDAVGIDAFIKLGLQFAVIIAFLLFGLEKANKMSGTAGKYAATIGGTAVLGGAAIAGRQLGGRVATWAKSESGLNLDKKLATSKLGRLALTYGLDKAATGTWDARATSIADKVAGQQLGSPGGQGGFAGALQKSQQANKATFDSLKGDTKAQARMVANLRKLGGGMININGVEQEVRINPDRDAMALMSKLSVKERQELIEASEGTKHGEYLKKINRRLAGEEIEQEENSSETNREENQPNEQQRNEEPRDSAEEWDERINRMNQGGGEASNESVGEGGVMSILRNSRQIGREALDEIRRRVGGGGGNQNRQEGVSPRENAEEWDERINQRGQSGGTSNNQQNENSPRRSGIMGVLHRAQQTMTEARRQMSGDDQRGVAGRRESAEEWDERINRDR
ncbi:MAG: hypothetical protein NTZ13_01235 [Candidatus Parcubacteria bacterium]|nr:hypothetical protein [Candidatus Parcubacteria bacterium]